MSASQHPKASSTEFKELVSQLPQEEFGKQEFWSNGKYRFEMLPKGYIALNKELATGFHKTLEEHLSNHPQQETDILLAVIAAWCGVVLDGTYTLAERDKLCYILAGRLEVLRETPAGIILAS